jgi:hypothetical protein
MHTVADRHNNCRFAQITVTTEDNRKVTALVVKSISKIAGGQHLYASYGSGFWRRWKQVNDANSNLLTQWDGEAKAATERGDRAARRLQ